MKKPITKCIALCVLLFTLGCEKEDVLQLQTSTADDHVNVSVHYAGSEALSVVTNAIDGTVGKGTLAWTHEKRDKDRFTIDREGILKVTDSVGNHTFALGIQDTEPVNGIFYNLVVTQRKDGKPIPPFVMRYKLKSGNTHDYVHAEHQKFEGKVDVFSLAEFASAVGLQGKAGDPVPCLDDIGPKAVASNATSGNNGSGSGGGNGAGGSGAPSGTSGFTPIGIFSVTISVTMTRGGSVQVGKGHFLPALPDKDPQRKGGIAAKDDIVICPDGILLIPIKPVVPPPPSCKSFKFESVGANWQSAAVKGVKFGVGTLLTNGNITIYRIEDYINQPILFETWKKDRFGNTISAGAAAEIFAEALKTAIKATAHNFKDKFGFSQTQVRLWFEDKLKQVFTDMSDGGRITFRNNRYNQTPTDYKTTLFGSDNCN
ncbi:hypothetical protein U1E44_00465 [Arenibacter sp. GZD96]|uniref:hypothetical protein n=1 Tax=Aurantibrevibacter litoralis TaxID=3106030 RepID=UPI002AFDFBB9|nr:hypothetical protein [Arenibacter sp. GZD-96]MEA1784551.1 hypothetical protein [Arenibacter sp. GZD-96]